MPETVCTYCGTPLDNKGLLCNVCIDIDGADTAGLWHMEKIAAYQLAFWKSSNAEWFAIRNTHTWQKRLDAIKDRLAKMQDAAEATDERR